MITWTYCWKVVPTVKRFYGQIEISFGTWQTQASSHISLGGYVFPKSVSNQAQDQAPVRQIGKTSSHIFKIMETESPVFGGCRWKKDTELVGKWLFFSTSRWSTWVKLMRDEQWWSGLPENIFCGKPSEQWSQTLGWHFPLYWLLLTWILSSWQPPLIPIKSWVEQIPYTSEV